MAHIIPPLTSLDHVRGDTGAVRTLIEYGDYQCPFCAAAEPVVLEILRRHPSGLAHVFRHFPLASIHPMAQPAAETVEFAADHGAFWAMHSVIMARSGSLSLSTMVGLAELLGLSGVGLRDALSTGAYAARVRHDMALGLHGTAHQTKAHPGFTILSDKGRNDGVKWPFTAFKDIEMTRFQGKHFTAILEDKTHPWRGHARTHAPVIALNQ